jgi:hypothetical protein
LNASNEVSFIRNSSTNWFEMFLEATEVNFSESNKQSWRRLVRSVFMKIVDVESQLSVVMGGCDNVPLTIVESSSVCVQFHFRASEDQNSILQGK